MSLSVEALDSWIFLVINEILASNTSSNLKPMTKRFSLTQILVAALAAVALIGVAAAASNYQGQVDFNLGTDGVNLKINGGEKTE